MAAVEIQLPEGFATVAEYAAEIKHVYKQYAHLPNMHIVDFFVTEFWQTLPREWQEYFEASDFELSSLLSLASTGQLDQRAPESLHSYVRAMFHLRLNYHGSPPTDQIEKEKHQQELWYFLDSMSPKKKIEVAELSQLVANVASESKCSLVVDVGAGQGYLSRVLAYSSTGLPVLAVDS
ncbi:hypothetical protein IW136_006285, partial [Coemansia sp. RSA 678]